MNERPHTISLAIATISLVIAVAGSACGFKPEPNQSDASTNVSPDAAEPADAAEPVPDGGLGEFSPPFLAQGLEDFQLKDPSLDTSGLSLYATFVDPTGDEDVVFARRSDSAAAFSAPSVFALGIPNNLTSPSITFSDDVMTLSVSNGNGGRDVALAEIEGDDLADPQVVEGLNISVERDSNAAFSADFLSVFYYSSRSGGGLLFAERNNVLTPFNPPSPVQELVDFADCRHPWVSPDGLTIYFDAPEDSDGTRDLYVATRPDVSAPFEAPTPLTVLNSNASDRDPWVSADGRELYFSSDRSGSFRIYRATR